MKLNYGDVERNQSNEVADIDVLMNAFPAGVIPTIIGTGLIVAGVGTMIFSAYVRGSNKYYEAETKALHKIGAVAGDLNEFVFKPIKIKW